MKENGILFDLEENQINNKGSFGTGSSNQLSKGFVFIQYFRGVSTKTPRTSKVKFYLANIKLGQSYHNNYLYSLLVSPTSIQRTDLIR